MRQKFNTTRNTYHTTTQHLTHIKGNADAAGAPEEQGQPTRKVEVERGRRGDEIADGRQCWERKRAGGEGEGGRGL